MTDIKKIEEIAERIGKTHGYEVVLVESRKFEDMKLRWQRSHSWINIQICDYIEGLSVAMFEELFKSLFERLAGNTNGNFTRQYSPELTKAFGECGMKKQKSFIRRKHATVDSEMTAVAQFITGDKDIRVVRANCDIVPYASTFFKTVVLGADGGDFNLLAEKCAYIEAGIGASEDKVKELTAEYTAKIN